MHWRDKSPSGSEGLLFHLALDFHPRVTQPVSQSVSQHERDRTRNKKAKDWDGAERNGKRDRVEVGKVHNLKFGQGIW